VSGTIRLGALLLALLACRPAHAQVEAATHDVQGWLLLVAQQPLGRNWIVHAEVQPRWKDDVSDRDQLILRGAIGRRLGLRVTAWAGYASVTRWTGAATLHEQRTWQQVSVALPARARWAPSVRVRQEQRYLDQWGDSSHRLRVLGRVVRPIGASPWALAVWDEWFLTLDDTAAGPRRGYDQNRLYLTTARRLSRALAVEGGYVWQHVPAGPATPTRHGHTLFAWLTYAPPPK